MPATKLLEVEVGVQLALLLLLDCYSQDGVGNVLLSPCGGASAGRGEALREGDT